MPSLCAQQSPRRICRGVPPAYSRPPLSRHRRKAYLLQTAIPHSPGPPHVPGPPGFVAGDAKLLAPTKTTRALAFMIASQIDQAMNPAILPVESGGDDVEISAQAAVVPAEYGIGAKISKL